MLHGGGIFTIIYLHNWAILGVNVGIHIPAPWSMWDMFELGVGHWEQIPLGPRRSRTHPDSWTSTGLSENLGPHILKTWLLVGNPLYNMLRYPLVMSSYSYWTLPSRNSGFSQLENGYFPNSLLYVYQRLISQVLTVSPTSWKHLQMGMDETWAPLNLDG